MKVPFIYHPIYSELQLPERHRYPIHKYKMLYQWALAHGARPDQFIQPTPMNWSQVALAHSSNYINKLITNQFDKKEWRKVGFPWSTQLLTRTLTSAGGTFETVKTALDKRIAIHFSGGYHHAHHDWGSGFCLINDLAMSAVLATKAQPNLKILIFDTDVHQGDGTATLLRDHENIFTCSIHGERNFPFTKVDSDLDVALPKGTTDGAYLDAVKHTLHKVTKDFKPDLILYDAGVDIYRRDDLGHLDVSIEGIFSRDYFVLDYAKQNNISLAAVIGGGYQRNLSRLILAHAQLLRASHQVWSD
ncbi:histone deacetylase [Idiomarina sp.]|uniref:histone deacetylase family protein n=1 Tax=Idiomarina sp. TaxID=1874361 RepID=UPI0025845C12|nr:histone deacetylase [Idiomarina sp.]